MRRAWPLICSLVLGGCGSPGAPEIPGRDEIGPPPEAALPSECVPPYPMSFGDDWFLLADLDRGEACFAYLERDECVLGIFVDCTDDSEDRRQWRGRVDLDPEGATAALETVYEPGASGSRLPRTPLCCSGEVHADTEDAWAWLSCQIERCGAVNDVTHAGLYLSRYDPDADPQAAIGPSFDVRAGSHALAFDRDAGQLWGASDDALFTVDSESGAQQMKASLTSGGPLVAGGGYAYAADGAALLIAPAAGAATSVPLPGPVTALAAGATGALVAVESPRPTVLLVDAASGTVTASAAAPAGVVAMRGEAPTYLVTDRDRSVFVVTSSLTVQAFWDTGAHIRQTGGAFMPAAPEASEAGVGVIGPCHSASSKAHCVFESDGSDAEPVRLPVAGVRRLLAAHWGGPRQVWVTVSDGGRITEIDAASRRPALQGQVRLDAGVRATAYDPATHRVFVLLEDSPTVIRVDLQPRP